MPFSVRFDRDTERRIAGMAEAAGRSRSQVVREAVAAYEVSRPAETVQQPSARQRLARFIGVVRGGDRTLSHHSGAAFRRLLESRGRRSR